MPSWTTCRRALHLLCALASQLASDSCFVVHAHKSSAPMCPHLMPGVVNFRLEEGTAVLQLLHWLHNTHRSTFGQESCRSGVLARLTSGLTLNVTCCAAVEPKVTSAQATNRTCGRGSGELRINAVPASSVRIALHRCQNEVLVSAERRRGIRVSAMAQLAMMCC